MDIEHPCGMLNCKNNIDLSCFRDGTCVLCGYEPQTQVNVRMDGYAWNNPVKGI